MFHSVLILASRNLYCGRVVLVCLNHQIRRNNSLGDWKFWLWLGRGRGSVVVMVMEMVRVVLGQFG
jgi:hypothetical protein